MMEAPAEGLISKMQVPKWFDDPDAPRPCPCGRPPQGPMVLFETEEGGTIVLHLTCAQQAGMIGETDGP